MSTETQDTRPGDAARTDAPVVEPKAEPAKAEKADKPEKADKAPDKPPQDPLSDRMILDFERPIIDLERKIAELRALSTATVDFSAEIRKLEQKARKLQKEIFADLSPQQKVQLSRHPGRPYLLDYMRLLVEDFVELHGDRGFSDDPAIIGGMARFDEWEVLVLGHQKGRNTKENLHRNFGMARPEGYRKATRLMRMASRFGRPILCFIDTPGAYPGLGAEERGQAEAIAKSLQVMASLEVPVISIVIGEGGSGGALALGVADRILMLEYAIYSVISPEGCASILWRDPTKVPEAAAQLKLTAQDLVGLSVCDEIIPEAPGGAHRDGAVTAAKVRIALKKHLRELSALSSSELIERRYQKFRAMGSFVETSGA
jgi:acetyl-CoA carboxylase carboxyl transferase subunit alpha